MNPGTDRPTSKNGVAMEQDVFLTSERSPQHGFQSPINDKLGVGLIGKFDDDLFHELSPIAPSRDSFNGNESVKAETAVAVAVAKLQEQENSGIHQSSGLENHGDSNSSCKPDAHGEPKQELPTREDGKDIQNSEGNEKRNVDWLLAADVTSPLSTSSEFSLESLPHDKKSQNHSLLSLSPHGEVVEEPQAAETELTVEPAKDAEVPESSLKMTDEYTKNDNDDSCNSNNENQNQQQPAAPAIHSSPIHRERSEQRQLQLSILSSDDVLVQDATEKVKKFIYELSVNSSRFSIADSSALELEEEEEEEEEKLKDDKECSRKDGSIDIDIVSPQDKDDRLPVTRRESLGQDNQDASVQLGEEQKLDDLEPSTTIQSDEEESKSPSLQSTSKRDVDWSSPIRSKSDSCNVSLSRTPGSQDLSHTKKELGASSSAFMSQVWGAAHRRKQNLTRSRDSLVAKQQKQLEDIASSKMALASLQEVTKPTPSAASEALHARKVRNKQFKAKPVPATNGDFGTGGMTGVPKIAKKQPTVPSSPLLGSRRADGSKIKAISASNGEFSTGGMTGVPKVAKKQPTVPSSPLLGARRPDRPKIRALEEPSTKPRTLVRRNSLQPSKSKSMLESKSRSSGFKARAAPPTTGQLGKSGQAGVPKVPKRPATIPSSPCLGPRRRHSVAVVAGKENQKQARRVSTGMLKTLSENKPATRVTPKPRSSSPFSFRSPLLGLEFLTPVADLSDEASTPVTTPQNAQTTAFEPQSTIRAKKRAEFDARRASNEQKRIADDVQQKEQRVKQMYKELNVLREVI